MEFSLDQLTDYLRSGALVVVLLIVLFMNDRSKFISVHILASVTFGLALILFPTYTVGLEVSTPLDEVSTVCCSVYGWALIGTTLVWYLTRNTRDGTVPITLMTAEVFSSSVTLLCQYHAYYIESRKPTSKGGASQSVWTPQYLTFGVLGTATLLVAHLVYLLRSHDFSSYPQHNIRVNEYLRLDAGLAMLLALTCLAFPDLIFAHFWPGGKAVSPVAVLLMRCTGALVLHSAFVSLQAAGFLHEKDKKKQFIGRLVGILLLFVPFIQGALMNGAFTLQQIELALLCLLPLVVNGILGYLAEGTITTQNKYR